MSRPDVNKAPIDRHLWSGAKYFTINEEYIAGTMESGKGRYGKSFEVKGTTTQVRQMLPSPSPVRDNWLVSNNRNDPKEVPSKAAEAVKKTIVQAQAPPPTHGYDLLKYEDIRSKYASKITNAEYRIWVNYQKGRNFSGNVIDNPSNGWSHFIEPISEEKYRSFHEQKLVGYDFVDGWVPAPIYYSGMVYDKLAEMARNKDAYVSVIGENGYELQLKMLENAAPKRLKLSGEPNSRLVIKWDDPFLNRFQLSQLADGTIFDEEQNIIYTYKQYLRSLPPDAFENSSAYDIIGYYMEKQRFPNDTSTAKKTETKIDAQKDHRKMWSNFLAEKLTPEAQRQIEFEWNREYNGFVEINYDRIPVGFECNRYFKDALIDPRPTLWQGVRFMNAVGSGIIAFDVGVGKTMTAILTLGQAMYTGQCKRPLVIVPNPTYANWILETIGRWKDDGTIAVNGILPQFQHRINDWKNLKQKNGILPVTSPPKDYEITFVTYEALEEIGFSKQAQNKVGERMLEILEQGLDSRDKQKMREKIAKMMGDANAGTHHSFDELGFDYIVADEAHNFNHVFTSVKGAVSDYDDEGQANRGRKRYSFQSGTPAAQAIKLFMMCQWVLSNNDYRNVCLLTATPFTNSPLEIFSMLAMVGYDKMVERNVNSVTGFFDLFVDESVELTVTQTNRLKDKTVIKSFSNRQVLQNLIFSYVIHKTGEEANVPRPVKVVYPRIRDDEGTLLPPEKQVDTALQPTKEQEYWLKQTSLLSMDKPNEIKDMMPRTYFDKGKVKGKDLVAISLAKQATLSPLLLTLKNEAKENIYLLDNPDPTAEEIVRSSPKLQYTIGCIKTIKEWHEARNEPMSGIVIYMNIGTGWFKTLRPYIAEQVGISVKEVAALSGGYKTGDKVKVMEQFLDGRAKVLIGSSTIKEGINLQDRATTLFNLTLDWNPGDIQQLEGRIYRQKNQHSHVRIVTPLIENSIDVFMFQKLEEKTSRINDIWYRAGRTNVFDVDKFDPQELKEGLLTDPTERAEAEISNEVKAIDRKIKIIDENLKEVSDARSQIDTMRKSAEEINGWLKEAIEFITEQRAEAQKRLKEDGYTRKDDKERDESTVRQVSTMLDKKDNENAQFAIIKRQARAKLKEDSSPVWRRFDGIDWYGRITECDQQRKRIEKMQQLQKNILDQYNVTAADDLEPIIKNMEQDRAKLAEDNEKVKSRKYLDERIDKYKKLRAESDKDSLPVSGRIEQFTTHNHLLSCLAKVHECDVDNTIIRSKPQSRVIEMKPECVKQAQPKQKPAPSDIRARIEALKIAYEITPTVDIQTRIDALEIALDLAA